ncbi:MAG: hypothetical protein ACT4ON_00515 [Bacteroidota bacterium]
MKNIVFSLIFICITGYNCYCQNDHKVAVGANRLTTSFILRNGMDNNISKGWGINFTLSKPSNSYRVTTQYAKYKTLGMEPVWKSVDAYKIESNFEVVTHFDNLEMLLYPFLGLSYNYISGLYTGRNDPDALRRFYLPNSVVTNKWLGLSCGLGLERTFLNHIVVFANYRMHIVKAEESIRIMDIGLDAGLKYCIDLKIKKRKKNTTGDTPVKKEKRQKKAVFKKLKMPNDRYDLN